MNLIELFEPNLIGRADEPAITFEDRTATFGDLDQQSSAVAASLAGRYQLQKGDRAAVYLANGLELIVFYLACLKLGVIVVPLNLLYRDRELTSLITDAEPKVLLTDGERMAVYSPLRRQFSSVQQVFVVGADGGPSNIEIDTIRYADLWHPTTGRPLPADPVTGDDVALMLFTSGTTGRSKGALLTHHNLASNIVALLHCWRWTCSDRLVLALPLFHIHGLCNGLHGGLASGCRTYLLGRFNAQRVMQMLGDHQGTMFFGVPTMYERLLEAADRGAGVPDAATMRLYVSGSAPLSPDTFARFEAAFGHEILERYGMSETAMITSNLYAGPRGVGTVGKPLPGVSVRIMKDDGRAAESPGDVGEIQVKGPNVLKAYWRQPQKTAESFDGGYFKTGDLGRWDEAGRLIICGRCKELIISGGYNIYPQELVNCICDLPGAAEAAVVGVPDRLRGELVKAYVVAADDKLTADDVKDHCRAHLASFKVPRNVVFIDELPRNAMGKIQLQKLPERDRP